MSQRIRRWLATFAALAISLTGVGLLGVIVAQQASADSVLFTATTQISNDGAQAGSPADFGTYGIWAFDGQNISGGSDPFTRTLTVNSTSASTCVSQFGSLPSGDTCYTASIADSGPFRTVVNAHQPNQGSTNTVDATGDTITHTVAGTFAGTASYVFYTASSTPLNADNVSSTLDVGDIADTAQANAANTTAEWFLQAFPSHVGVIKFALLNSWTWTYVTTNCSETWTDARGDGNPTSSIDAYGQSTPLSTFGEIVGLISGETGCTPPVTDAVSITNPGTQDSLQSGSANLQIVASDSLGKTLGYSATGLPPGLGINGSTGLISGTPTTLGTFTVTVTASDGTVSNSTTFSWVISSAVGGPPPSSNFGNFVNPFGNGLDVRAQHFSGNTPVIDWPANQADPATEFERIAIGGNWEIEAAPFGNPDGLCVSNPAGGYVGDPGGPNGLVLRNCNGSVFQQFVPVSVGGHNYLDSAVNLQVLVPSGKGTQWNTASAPVSWGGSVLNWVPETSLP